MGYGLRLKLKRTEKGYTQRQLGVKAGVTEQSISNYEREKKGTEPFGYGKHRQSTGCRRARAFFQGGINQ